MHTNPARKPYCRKGFGICIQCIQRIPTPFVFVFSLLLGREYMNTVNTIGRDGAVVAGVRQVVMRAVRPVPEPVTLYSAALVNTRRHHRRSGARTPKSGRTTRDTPRLYALYSVVFRCRMHTFSA